MKIGDYEIDPNNPICETYNTVLYRAVKNNMNIWILKQYKSETDINIQYEKDIVNDYLLTNKEYGEVVIPIIESGVDTVSNKEYIVMQYKQNGFFLNEYLERECTLQDAIDICEQILKSLIILHENFKIAHLDLHPGNIFLEVIDSNTNMVKFIDFANSSCEGKHNNNIKFYTEGFSALELKEALGDYKSDLYSVSAIFYYILLGERYSQYNIEHQRIDKLYNITGSNALSYLLECFLSIGLHSKTCYRFHNAREMLDDLQRIKNIYLYKNKNSYWKYFNCLYEYGVRAKNVNDKIANRRRKESKVDEGSWNGFDKFAEMHILWDEYEYSDDDLKYALQKILEELYSSDFDTTRLAFVYYQLLNIYMSNSGHVNNQYPIKELLLTCGIRVANHTASNELFSYLEKIYKELKTEKKLKHLSTLKTIVAMAEHYIDICDYVEAYKYYEDCIKDCDEYIYHNNEFDCSEYYVQKAKALSGRACLRCFDGSKNEVEIEKEFREAISLFEEFGKKEDKQITVCHLLHFAIMFKNKNLYEEYVDTYFDVDWLYDLKSNYSIFLGLKGYYTFGKPYICIDNIMDILKAIEQKSNKFHPIQLIYKYLAFIIWDKDDEIDYHIFKKKGIGNTKEDVFKKLIQKSVSCIAGAELEKESALTVLKLINYQTQAWEYKILNKTKDNNELWLELYENLYEDVLTSDLNALKEKYYKHDRSIKCEEEVQKRLLELLNFEYA